jgi:hypothetical protein
MTNWEKYFLQYSSEEVSADHLLAVLNRKTNLPNQNLIIEPTKVPKHHELRLLNFINL